MVAISISVTESVEQVVAGIPRSVSISTNIPATIFYTLDGSAPTLDSIMYVGTIILPTNLLSITLSILASNGVETSPVVIEQYQTNMVEGNARLPHSGTTARAGSFIPDSYPFGNPPFQPKQQFTNPADVGPYNGAVYDPNLPAVSGGFDGAGNPNDFTNQPFNVENYQIVYTDRDAEGATNYGLVGRGVAGAPLGNIPGQVELPYPSDIQPDPGQTSNQGPEQTNQFTTLFDPRAFVIFQDFSQEDPTDPPMINRQYFSLENPERVRDGALLREAGFGSSLPPSGSYIRSHFNPRDNTITHYYRDSWANRWIISKAPYQPTGTWDGNMAQMALGFKSSAGMVFEWIPNARRVLF